MWSTPARASKALRMMTRSSSLFQTSYDDGSPQCVCISRGTLPALGCHPDILDILTGYLAAIQSRAINPISALLGALASASRSQHPMTSQTDSNAASGTYNGPTLDDCTWGRKAVLSNNHQHGLVCRSALHMLRDYHMLLGSCT
eukprot:5904302-Amphidinium_carterae.1